MPNGIGSRIKTGSCQTGQLPGRIKSELCDSSGLRIDLISRLLSLSRLYSGILHSLSLSLCLPFGREDEELSLSVLGGVDRGSAGLEGRALRIPGPGAQPERRPRLTGLLLVACSS